MLISNYLQSYVDADNQDFHEKRNYYKQTLEEEIEKYQKLYNALLLGDETLKLKENSFESVTLALKEYNTAFNQYIQSTESVIENPDDIANFEYVKVNAMPVKNSFDHVTAQYQALNDIYIHNQRKIDLSMITFGAVATFMGIVLSVRIKEKEYHANFDYLTKLKNRHSMFEDITKLRIDNCSMFFIDLNKFKLINDTFGHETGDEILVEVSQRLGKVFGFVNLYRYGGDEFIAIRDDSEEDSITESIDHKIYEVRRCLSKPVIDTLGRQHFVGLSVGAVSSEVGLEDWDQLINLSDDLMYDSKAISGNVIICHTKKEYEARIKISKMIDEILMTNSIQLNYQPIKTVSNGKIVMYNITSAWESGNENFRAAEFLPILKRKGHLIDVDKNIFGEINRNYDNLAVEQGEKSIKYSVNLSEEAIRSFNTNGLEQVLSFLKVPKNLIIIKVHEALLGDKDIVTNLKKIKGLGFLLAVDDIVLDTSLLHSKTYNLIDFVKIGNSMSNALLQKEETRRIFKEVIGIFTLMNKAVIIEGVNRDELINIMTEEWCLEHGEKLLYSQRMITKKDS